MKKVKIYTDEIMLTYIEENLSEFQLKFDIHEIIELDECIIERRKRALNELCIIDAIIEEAQEIAKIKRQEQYRQEIIQEQFEQRQKDLDLEKDLFKKYVNNENNKISQTIL